MNYKKIIGIDLRFLKQNDDYSDFVYNLVLNLIKNKKEYLFKIFLNINFTHLNFGENSKNIFTKIKYGNIIEHKKFTNILNKNKLDLVLFFKYKKPIFYKKNYYIFYPDLSKFHFPEQESFLIKIINNFLLKKNLINSQKIICFNQEQKNEINEKLNIIDSKIEIIQGFFQNKEDITNEILNIDLKTKYNIKGDYLIYNSGVGTEKNLDKIIATYKKVKSNNIDMNLVILDENTIQDIDFRRKVIEENLVSNIFFIGKTNNIEENIFYKNAIAILYPTLYCSFPFSLNKAINNNLNILSSKIDTINEIFGTNIVYFNQNSTNEFYEKLISLQKIKINYNNIINKYNIEYTVNMILEIM